MKNYNLVAALGLPLIAATSMNCGARSGLDETAGQVSIFDFPHADVDTKPDAAPLPDAGSDASPDADAGLPPIQYITREQLARTLKEEVMYYPDFQEPCTPSFPDIQADSTLCRTTNFLLKKGIMQGYPDGKFKPNNNVNHSELWKHFAVGLQFTPYNAPCLKSYNDLNSDAWYYHYAGAICDKGISLSNSPESLPGELTTIQELTKTKTQAIAYLSQPMDRQTVAETLTYTFFKQAPVVGDVSSCISKYNDIPNGSLTCFQTNYLIDQGLLNTINPSFNPKNQVNNGEIAKFYVLAAGFPVEITGCSQKDPGKWYTPYMDALCEAGWIDSKLDPEDVYSRWVESQFAWDIAFSIK